MSIVRVNEYMVEVALEAANGQLVDTRRHWTEHDKAVVRAMLESAITAIRVEDLDVTAIRRGPTDNGPSTGEFSLRVQSDQFRKLGEGATNNAGQFSSTTHGVTHMPTDQRSSQQSSSDAPEARSTETPT